MTIKIIEKGEDNIGICDLMENVKNNPKIIECGAIFSFEGIVRGKEMDKNNLKMDLTTQTLRKQKPNFKDIVKDIKINMVLLR